MERYHAMSLPAPGAPGAKGDPRGPPGGQAHDGASPREARGRGRGARAGAGSGGGDGSGAGAGAGGAGGFLYGTHYSTPAYVSLPPPPPSPLLLPLPMSLPYTHSVDNSYVLHFLVRAAPQHALRLHGPALGRPRPPARPPARPPRI